jgi:hypothetical protein
MEKNTSIALYEDLAKTSLALVRHELKVGDSDEMIESIKEELEIDKQLGLEKQAKITVEKALQHDIDNLTSSNDFFEVSQNLMQRLFQISMLERKCFFANTLNMIKGVLTAGVLPLSLHVLFLLSIYPMLKFSMWIWPITTTAPTAMLVFISILNCILWCSIIVPLGYGFSLWGNIIIKYPVLRVKMESKPLSSVSDKIPYGAKLKVLEAKKTGIFQDFVFITPEFSVKNEEYKVRFPSIDPAILGITADKRMFMIVYWDIDKDVAKVIKEIELFKKFKLNKTV